jgi:hypothetical protein
MRRFPDPVAAGVPPAVEPGVSPGEFVILTGELSKPSSGRRDAALHGRRDACLHTAYA